MRIDYRRGVLTTIHDALSVIMEKCWYGQKRIYTFDEIVLQVTLATSNLSHPNVRTF